ncbi:TPA: hypothetical protein ACIAIE_005314 [Serratia fonticola]
MITTTDNPLALIDTLLKGTWLFVKKLDIDHSALVSDHSALVSEEARTLVENALTALTERRSTESHIDTIADVQSTLLDETVPTRLNPRIHKKDILRCSAPDSGVSIYYRRVLSLGLHKGGSVKSLEYQKFLNAPVPNKIALFKIAHYRDTLPYSGELWIVGLFVESQILLNKLLLPALPG